MSGEHTPLLPCPFCGSADARRYADTIECAQCDAQGPSMCGRHGWNKRPERDELLEALEPFAAACTVSTFGDADNIDDTLAANKITWGDLRRARTAIQKARG